MHANYRIVHWFIIILYLSLQYIFEEIYMEFAGDLESLEADTTNTYLNFNEDFNKLKEYIEQATVKFEKWEKRLQERERKIEEKEKKIEIMQEVSLFTLITWCVTH